MAPKLTLENEIRWPRRVRTAREAVKYIDATGYCMLYPVANVPLPSLYYAVRRRNPQVGFVWDKYSVMLWRWKDELPRRRRAFYAKYFRARGSLASQYDYRPDGPYARIRRGAYFDSEWPPGHQQEAVAVAKAA